MPTDVRHCRSEHSAPGRPVYPIGNSGMRSVASGFTLHVWSARDVARRAT
jgi:hypothetical protein